MHGLVLTDHRHLIQAVQVFDADNNQIAIVLFKVQQEPLVKFTGNAFLRADVISSAQEALQVRDAAEMSAFMDRMRAPLFTSAGISGCTQPVLSPGGRKMSFSFMHQALGRDQETYEVIIRRRRRDPGSEGDG